MPSRPTKPIRLARLTLALACAGAASAYAATPLPDAGSVLRDQTPPKASAPRGDATLPQAAEPAVKSADPTPIAVTAITVTGATVFTADELQALVADTAGGERTLAELQRAAAKITLHYRRAGYFLARAYLPQQAMADGVVTIAVLEGRLAEVKLDNASRVSDDRVQARLAQFAVGAPLQKAPTDRAILLLSDTPGVGGVDTRLEAGANPGETVLVAAVKPAPLWSGRLEADNHGSLYSGRYRAGASVDLSSPLGYGERFSARVMASNEALVFGRLAASVPVGAEGLTVGAALGHTQYSLGDSFAALDAVGSSDTAELNLRYPIVRSTRLNVFAQAGAEYRKLRDEIRSTNTRTDKHASVGSVGLAADWRDGLLGGGASQINLGLVHGVLNIESPTAAALDAAGARTEGAYNKVTLSVDRQQAVVGALSLAVQARAQWTNDNLDSSEKFVLGGANGVRAYPSGEGSGDQGWLATAELRYPLMAQINASVFYDAGGIRVNANPYLPTDNTRFVSGAGVGVSGGWGDFDWRLTVAWRNTASAVSEPDKTPRVWLQIGWRF